MVQRSAPNKVRRRRKVHIPANRPSKISPAALLEMEREEIVSAVAGRTIQWRNSLTGGIEQGKVPDSSSFTNVCISGANGRRFLLFNAVGETGRACYLDAIIKVV